MNLVLEASLEGTRVTFRQTYNHYAAIMRFLMDLGIPLPDPLLCTADFVLNLNLNVELKEPGLSPEAVQNIVRDAQALRIKLDDIGLEYTLRKNIERLANQFLDDPDNLDNLKRLTSAVDVGKEMPFQLNLWVVQNTYYEMMHTVLPERRWKAERGAEEATEWVEQFIELGRKLSVRVE